MRRPVGVGLEPGDQRPEIVRRYFLLGDDDRGVDGEHADRREIIQDMVWKVVDRTVDNVGSPEAEAKRVAIGWRARDPTDSDAAGRAADIFNDDGLAKGGLHPLGQHAADDVGRAAGGKRNHQRDRLCGIGLRRCGGDPDGDTDSGEKHPTHFANSQLRHKLAE